MPNYHVYACYADPSFGSDTYVSEVEAPTAPAAIQAVVDDHAKDDNTLTVESALKYSYRAYLVSAATELSPKLVV